MNSSPVLEILCNVIHIDKKQEKPIYLQLTEQIAYAIQNRILATEIFLPGTRMLSHQLQLHRKTVVAAYEELVAQGVVTSIPNKGTFVNKAITFSSTISETDTAMNHFPEKAALPIFKSRILEIPNVSSSGSWIVEDGQMDMQLFDTEKWKVNLNNRIHKQQMSSLYLKNQLRFWIEENENIQVHEGQLLITHNASMSFAILTQTILNKDDIVVCAAPGNYKFNMAIQQVGAQLRSVQMEVDGLDIYELQEICKKQKVKLVYVQPQHHYPNTTILSYPKRLELLRLASQYQFFILEDETYTLYDFQKYKIPSLAHLDTLGHVIQIHSLEQAVRSDYSIAYVLAPNNIILEMEKMKAYLGLTESSLPEYMIANTFQSKYFQRNAKKTAKIYLQRRNACCQMIQTHWSEYAQFHLPKTGLAVWVDFNWDFNLAAFAKKASEHGLIIPNHLLYQSRKWNGLRWGFGRWKEEEMQKMILVAKDCF